MIVAYLCSSIYQIKSLPCTVKQHVFIKFCENMSSLLLTSWIVRAREDLSRRPQINKNDGHILLQLCFTTCSWTLEVFSLAVQLFIVDSIMQPWGQLVSDNYYTMINCRDMVCFQWKGNNICQFKSLVSNINNIAALSMHIVNFPSKRAPILCKHTCIC